MAFCMYCGKELKDGEVCSCRTTAAEGSEAGAAAATEAAQAAGATAQAAGAAAQAAGATAQAAGATAQAAGATAQAAGATAQAAGATAQTAGAAAQPTAGATTQAAGAAQTAAAAAAAPRVDAEKIASAAKKVGGMYLKIWAKPATVGKEMMASVDLIHGICLVVVQALLSSIFSLCIVGKINSAFSGYTGLLGGYGDEFKVSGVKAFFLTLLLSILFSAIWGLVFGLIGLISKAKMGLGQILALMAARSVIIAPLTVLACIILLFNPAVALLIYFGSILMVMCTTAEMLKAIQGVNADKCVYLTFIGVLLFIVVFVLIGFRAIGACVPEGITSLGRLSNMF